jgi:hypothetical protein
MSLLILVVDDEPDVEVLFRQHFRRDLSAGGHALVLGERSLLMRSKASQVF